MPVKSTWGGSQFYDENGEKLPDSTVFARAGKWVLVGVAGLIGLFVALSLAGVALQRFGVATKGTTAADRPLNSPTTVSPDESMSAPTSSKGDKYVAAVRDGVLASHNTTTIGKAFEATFTACGWESSVSDKGARFVEFTGRLKPEMVRDQFESVRESYQSCLDAPPRENPIKAWYAEKSAEGTSALGRLRNHQTSDIEVNGISCSAKYRLPAGVESGVSSYVPVCTDRDGNTLDSVSMASLPPLAKASCGNLPDASAYSTVKFQFVFSADGSSFEIGYIDLQPWERTTLYTFKATGTTKRFTRFRDGSPNAQWTETHGESSAAVEDILEYIYK